MSYWARAPMPRQQLVLIATTLDDCIADDHPLRLLIPSRPTPPQATDITPFLALRQNLPHANLRAGHVVLQPGSGLLVLLLGFDFLPELGCRFAVDRLQRFDRAD